MQEIQLETIQYDPVRGCLTMEADPSIRNRYELRMLEENRIEGLLPLSVCDDNGILRLNYDVSALIPLSDITDRSGLLAGDLRRLILTLRHIVTGMEPYLLAESGILLKPETVYLESGSRSPHFLYLPCRKSVFAEELSEFLKDLMSGTDQNDYAGMVLAYRLYRESLEHPGGLDCLEQILISQEDLHPAAAPARDAGGYEGDTADHVPEAYPEGIEETKEYRSTPGTSPHVRSAEHTYADMAPPAVLEVGETTALSGGESGRGAGLFRRLFRSRSIYSGSV